MRPWSPSAPLQAGTKENVIPDEALLKLNVRTFDETVRNRVLAAIERIVKAEADASGAPKPPEITTLDHYNLVRNDPEATKRVADAFREHFTPSRVPEAAPTTASEDFGSFGAESGTRRVLVCRRYRSRCVCEGESAGTIERTADQSQPALCARHPSDFGNGRRSIGSRAHSLARG